MRAIIINHNTRLVTCLSLLSALRYADCPVTLIDCESTDGSLEYFKCLQQKHSFDLITAPLLPHGKTLDRIFSETTEDRLLLIDSDLEILSASVFKLMDIEKGNVYGSGFLLHGHIITEAEGMNGWLYYERPFMPIVLLKTAPIKEALQKGVSFNADSVNNEFTLLPKSFYWQAKKIFKTGFRRKVAGFRPAKVVYDTGARMHEYLKSQRYTFDGLKYSTHTLYVKHYHGATRQTLYPNANLVGEDVKNGKIENIVQERLRLQYDFQ